LRGGGFAPRQLGRFGGFTRATTRNLYLAKEENMFKRILSFMLIVLLLNVIGVSPAYAAGVKQEKGERKAEKIKASILKLGTGKEARVAVRLKNRSIVEGYVSEASDKTFVVVAEKSGIITTIPYLQVNKLVSGKGVRIAKDAAKGVAIFAGFIGGLLLIVYLSLRGS